MERTEYNLIDHRRGPPGWLQRSAAYDAGERSILILERDTRLGGILNQCIHNGFGLHTFQEELTGPEYAQRYIDKVPERGIEYKLDTMVMSIGQGEDGSKEVMAVNESDGLLLLKSKALILTMGCRERSRGALNIPVSVLPAFFPQAPRSGWSISKAICRAGGSLSWVPAISA